jgi:hypothetical protein
VHSPGYSFPSRSASQPTVATARSDAADVGARDVTLPLFDLSSSSSSKDKMTSLEHMAQAIVLNHAQLRKSSDRKAA